MVVIEEFGQQPIKCKALSSPSATYMGGALSGGTTAGAVRGLVSPEMDMVVAMLIGMVIGMILHLTIGLLLTPRECIEQASGHARAAHPAGRLLTAS